MSSVIRFLKILFLAAIVAVFIAFAIDNRDVTSISLFPLPYSADLPKFLLVMGCFALGAVVGGLTVNFKLFQARRQYKAEHRRAEALKSEITTLQEKPLRAIGK